MHGFYKCGGAFRGSKQPWRHNASARSDGPTPREKVGSVNGNVFAILRKLRAQGGDDRSEGCLYQGAVRAEFHGEAVAGPLRGRTADGLGEGAMLRDQAGRASPSVDRIQAFDETGPTSALAP